MVSYDDAESFGMCFSLLLCSDGLTHGQHSITAAKGNFINSAGLRGFAMWEAGGDFNDILLDAISNAIGIEEVC